MFDREREERFVANRKQGIGGSDAAPIMRSSSYKSPLEVWREKVEPDLVTPLNYHMRRGRRQESVALNLYREETGAEVFGPERLREMFSLDEFATFYHPDAPYRISHVDGLERLGGEWRLAEVKVPSIGAYRRFQREGLNTEWLIQTQHYMDVVGAHLERHGERLRPESRYIVFNPELDDFQFPLIERDIGLTSAMVEAEVDFWQLVVAKVPPQAEEYAPTLPRTDEVHLSPDAAATAAIEALAQNARILRDLESQKEEARQLLLSLGLTPGRYITPVVDGTFYQLNLREQGGRVTLDTKALRASHPEIDYSRYEKQGKPFFVVDIDERRAK